MMRVLQRSRLHLISLLLNIANYEYSELKSQWRLKYDAKTHRIRCQGHILNLCTQAFLFVTNTDNLEELSNSTNKYNITLAEIDK